MKEFRGHNGAPMTLMTVVDRTFHAAATVMGRTCGQRLIFVGEILKTTRDRRDMLIDGFRR